MQSLLTTKVMVGVISVLMTKQCTHYLILVLTLRGLELKSSNTPLEGHVYSQDTDGETEAQRAAANARCCWGKRGHTAPELTVCVCSTAQSCLTVCNPLDCSPPRSSVHGIFQARIPEWVAISSSRGSSLFRDQIWSRDQIHISFISCMAGGCCTDGPSEKALNSGLRPQIKRQLIPSLGQMGQLPGVWSA